MVNICKLLINVVITKQAKGADRLEPKGKWAGSETFCFSDADVAPPAERQHLTHLMVCRRNVVSPKLPLVTGKVNRKVS